MEIWYSFLNKKSNNVQTLGKIIMQIENWIGVLACVISGVIFLGPMLYLELRSDFYLFLHNKLVEFYGNKYILNKEDSELLCSKSNFKNYLFHKGNGIDFGNKRNG